MAVFLCYLYICIRPPQQLPLQGERVGGLITCTSFKLNASDAVCWKNAYFKPISICLRKHVTITGLPMSWALMCIEDFECCCTRCKALLRFVTPCGTWAKADYSETILPARELLKHWITPPLPPKSKKKIPKVNWMKQGIPSTLLSPYLLQNVYEYLAHTRRQCCTNTDIQNIIQPHSLKLPSIFNEDENSRLHPHLKVVNPAPSPFPFFSLPPLFSPSPLPTIKSPLTWSKSGSVIQAKFQLISKSLTWIRRPRIPFIISESNHHIVTHLFV